VRGLAALALVLSAGCQVTPTHLTQTSYYEHDGMWCGSYDIGFEEARFAVHATLADLKMPIGQEGPDRRGAFLDTRTPDGYEARVVILPPGRRGSVTRICVRIGGFGTHRAVCERLLDEIARHLDAARHRYTPAAPVAPVAAPPGPTAPPQAQAPEPSLPPQPVPVGP
jgi:hypothetical protein